MTSQLAALAATKPICAGLAPVPSPRRVTDRPATWYGFAASWQEHVERGLIRRHPGQVSATNLDRGVFLRGGTRLRVYDHTGLYVPGRDDLIPVRVEFHERPTYPTWGLASEHYPRVFADPGAASAHRMPDDDALCLYHPDDPAERRWTATDGLVSLFNIVVNHLFSELRWRNTGGSDGGVWPLDEAPHGFVAKEAS